MSTDLSPTAAKRPVGVVRILFPAIIIGLAAAVLLVAWRWPGTEVDSSTISMVKSLTVIVAGVLLFLWALRMPGWRKRYVWLAFLGGIALSMAFVRFHSMWGKFLPIFVARDWVQDAFFGGSPDTVLERHRQAQGRAEGGADLTVTPGDWPGYRGANRDGVATGTPIARDWSTNPPKEVWRQPIGGGYAGFSYANGFLVTIEQRRDQEVVVCYEATAGKEVWTTGWDSRFSESAGGDGPRATPTIAEGDVFAYGATGRLVCLAGKDGKEKWAENTLEGNQNLRWGMSGSPLVVDNLVIINVGAQTEAAKGRALRAYDRATGKEAWAAGNYPAGYSSPQLATLGGKRQVLLFDAHGIAGHDLDGGAQLWRMPWKTDYDVNVAQPVVIGDDTLVIGSGYNHGGARIRIKNSGGTWSVDEVWHSKRTEMRYKFANPVRRQHAGGDFVFGLNDGNLECVDVKTGRPRWKDDRRAEKEGAFGHGQIVLCDDRIVALTEFGELVLVEATPEEFRELSRVKALYRGTKTWNNPAMAHGRIYIRNDGEMACYDLTGQ
jgi:outer membrane protein assembly factor BamB